jgi:hypothetical protein
MDCESSGDAVLDRYSFEVGSSGLISSSNLNPSFVSGHLGLVLCQPVDIPLPGISDSRVSAAYIYWSQVFKVTHACLNIIQTITKLLKYGCSYVG